MVNGAGLAMATMDIIKVRLCRCVYVEYYKTMNDSRQYIIFTIIIITLIIISINICTYFNSIFYNYNLSLTNT